MARILIAGYGKLGSALGKQLTEFGHTVTGMRRSAVSATDVARVVQADLCDPQSLQSTGGDFDLAVLILTPLARSPEGYQRIYQHGIDNLLDYLDAAGRQLPCIFVSATSVYAQDNGEWVDEHSQTRPTSYNGRSLLAAEQRILDFHPRSLVVRFSGIYGPDRRRTLSQLEKPLQIQQSPPLFSNRIHQQDCVAVLDFLCNKLCRDEPLHRHYLASDDLPEAKFTVLSWLAREAGLAHPVAQTLPDNAPRNKRCRNTRLTEAGYRFIYPDYRAGYKTLLARR